MGDPLATLGSSQRAFRVFLSIGVIWNLSGGGPGSFLGFSGGAPWRWHHSRGGPRRILSVFANTEKGQRLLTFKGWGVNGR